MKDRANRTFTKIVKYLCHPATDKSEMHLKSLRIQNSTSRMYLHKNSLQKEF